jgi:hypothetical protein
MILLDDWQKDVLEHKGDFLLCTGRRVGKTYIMARKAVDYMVKYRKSIIVVSLTEDQAMLIIQMALNYAMDTYPKLVGRGKYKPQLKKFWLNKVKMEARPVGATGDSVRGFEGGVLIVDEAARMPEHFWMAAKPIILTTGGEIWMASTPFGKQGYFWQKFDESHNQKAEDSRFKVFYVTTVEVMKNRPISVGWTERQREDAVRILEIEEKEMSRLEFGQEYLGLFMEDLQQFFPDELIKKCQTERRTEGIEKGVYYLGVDIARMGEDQTTFEILKLDNDRMVQVENQITTKTYLTETTRHIIALNKQYDFKKIYIDDEGIGVGVFDALMDETTTKRKTEGLNNSKRVIDADGKEKGILKTDLYNNLRYLMETEKIKLLNDYNLFNSLKSVQYEYTKDVQGKPHLKIHGKDTHICEGLIRAAWGWKTKQLNIWITSF